MAKRDFSLTTWRQEDVGKRVWVFLQRHRGRGADYFMQGGGGMNETGFFGLGRRTIVAFIENLFERCGGEQYLGEAVTMAEHMLQGATIAERNGDSEEIVVAALLHDIGHFVGGSGSFSMNDTEDRFHEKAGARLLEPFFPGVVVDCCRYHVAAKRYLCATDPSYFDTLSDASVHSLKLQGGPMNAEEAARFETLSNCAEIVSVRRLDDAGKQVGMATPGFAHFAPMLQRIVDAQSGDPLSRSCPEGSQIPR